MGKLLKSYFFWTYDRGSIHFDIMVTAILLFMFVSPHYIDFKDRPVETVALHSSEVLVKEDGVSGDRARFIYQIRADNMGNATTDDQIRTAILRLVEPISGEVTVVGWKEVKDASGHIVAYNATVLR